MTLLRGKLVSFSSTPYTATVRLDGSPTKATGPFRVSRGLPTAELSAGRSILIDSGDHGDPADYVLIAVWT